VDTIKEAQRRFLDPGQNYGGDRCRGKGYQPAVLPLPLIRLLEEAIDAEDETAVAKDTDAALATASRQRAERLIALQKKPRWLHGLTCVRPANSVTPPTSAGCSQCSFCKAERPRMHLIWDPLAKIRPEEVTPI